MMMTARTIGLRIWILICYDYNSNNHNNNNDKDNGGIHHPFDDGTDSDNDFYSVEGNNDSGDDNIDDDDDVRITH